jgi:hypothetical protein
MRLPPDWRLKSPNYVIKPKYGNQRQLHQLHKVHHSSDQYTKFTYYFDPFGVSYEKLERYREAVFSLSLEFFAWFWPCFPLFICLGLIVGMPWHFSFVFGLVWQLLCPLWWDCGQFFAQLRSRESISHNKLWGSQDGCSKHFLVQ